MAHSKRALVLLAAVTLSALGVGLAYELLAQNEPQTFVLVASGITALGIVSAFFAVRSSWPFSPPLTLQQARKELSHAEQEIDFSRAVVGVGEEGSSYSFAAFWMLADATIVAMYLRPKWPYLPLLVDEGWQSLDEALSTELGRTVRLLAQGDYADSLQAKYFRMSPVSE